MHFASHGAKDESLRNSLFRINREETDLMNVGVSFNSLYSFTTFQSVTYPLAFQIKTPLRPSWDVRRACQTA